jgi:uncharacterized membrane protein
VKCWIEGFILAVFIAVTFLVPVLGILLGVELLPDKILLVGKKIAGIGWALVSFCGVTLLLGCAVFSAKENVCRLGLWAAYKHFWYTLFH